MVFRKKLVPPSTRGARGSIDKHVGKGASEEMLPSRGAMQSLTSGSPLDRTMNDYAKKTPVPSPVSSAAMDADDSLG
jgi:hypothetical protein